jgi:outer membrane protein assembly factor BamB
VTGDTIDDVHGYDLGTGRPLWLETSLPPEAIAAVQASSGWSNASRSSLGVPKFTLTVDGDRLYVKLGPQATAAPVSDRRDAPPLGYLAALDLQAEKKRLFEIHLDQPPWGDGWAIEGVPLAADGRLYVALRQRDSVRTQTHVAAFDAKRGELVWQRFVAAAESFGQAQAVEYTHNLLSLDEGVLYYNTNLGVVAAVRASDGQVQWVTRYPQLPADESPADGMSPSRVGDPTPCLIYQGLVLAAPSDCDRVFALDAATGLRLWETAPEAADDVRHLLGVGGGNLIASGRRLYWIDVETGKMTASFPASVDEALGGYGRGILAGGQVYWPTRDRIYVFDQRGPRQTRQPLDLAPLGLTGGNLLISRDTLLIAGADRLSTFRTSGPQITKPAGQP